MSLLLASAARVLHAPSLSDFGSEFACQSKVLLLCAPREGRVSSPLGFSVGRLAGEKAVVFCPLGVCVFVCVTHLINETMLGAHVAVAAFPRECETLRK